MFLAVFLEGCVRLTCVGLRFSFRPETGILQLRLCAKNLGLVRLSVITLLKTLCMVGSGVILIMLDTYRSTLWPAG